MGIKFRTVSHYPKYEEKVYLEDVQSPAFIYETETCARLKYGEKETMEEWYELMRPKYESAGFPIAWVELPANQELIDDLFNNRDFFEKFLKEHFGAEGESKNGLGDNGHREA